jgi:hypothetical protein
MAGIKEGKEQRRKKEGRYKEKERRQTREGERGRANEGEQTECGDRSTQYRQTRRKGRMGNACSLAHLH